MRKKYLRHIKALLRAKNSKKTPLRKAKNYFSSARKCTFLPLNQIRRRIIL